MELKVPRRKRCWDDCVTSQQNLPIPFQIRNGLSFPKSSWPTYTGQYNGDSVVISDIDDMDRISSQGCFGKGSQSKNVPNFYKIIKGEPPLIRERQWKQRCSWASLRKQSLETPSTTSSNLFLTQNDDNCEPHEKSIDDKEGSEVLVVNDSDTDCDEETYLNNLKTHVEIEPSFIGESLHLTLEEAFFLSFALGCLRVLDLNGTNLSIVEMWNLFRESQEDFLQMYVAYHYFRSKGWVVKPGLKFGGDFVLYKQGPSFYHASYIVKVFMEEKCDMELDTDNSNSLSGWIRLMGLNRLAETAAKEIILCHVIKPKDILVKDLRSPRVLSKFTVYEILVQRWVSSQERDKATEET